MAGPGRASVPHGEGRTSSAPAAPLHRGRTEGGGAAGGRAWAELAGGPGGPGGPESGRVGGGHPVLPWSSSSAQRPSARTRTLGGRSERRDGPAVDPARSGRSIESLASSSSAPRRPPSGPRTAPRRPRLATGRGLLSSLLPCTSLRGVPVDVTAPDADNKACGGLTPRLPQLPPATLSFREATRWVAVSASHEGLQREAPAPARLLLPGGAPRPRFAGTTVPVTFSPWPHPPVRRLGVEWAARHQLLTNELLTLELGTCRETAPWSSRGAAGLTQWLA